MAETADDLSAPLGQKTARQKRRFRLPFTAMQALAVLLGPVPGRLRRLRRFQRQPARRRAGRAYRAAARRRRRSEKPAMAAAAGHAEQAMKAAPKQAATGDNKTVTIIDGSSGKRQDVADRQATPPTRPAPEPAPGDDGRHRPAPAGEIALRHDPGRRRRPEAVHGLCRPKPTAPRPPRCPCRHRRRRPRRRRRQDHRCHHEAAAGGDAGVHALWRGSRQARRAGPRAAPRDPAADPDGAVRLSRQRSRPADPADDAGARAEYRPAVLAPQPVPGLCRHRQFHGRALRGHRRRDAADHPRGGQARPRLSR